MWLLVGLNAAIFAATLTASAFGIDLISVLGLHADGAAPWQWASYMFTHAGLLHILVNMLVLTGYGTLASALGLGRAVAPLYLAGGLAGAAAFACCAPAEAILTGASASVLALVGALTLWGASLRVAIPWAGRVRLIYVSLLIVALALCSAISTGHSGALAAHAGGLIAGLIAGLLSPGRSKVKAWLHSHRSTRELRQQILEKARFSGYDALTDAEKKAL